MAGLCPGCAFSSTIASERVMSRMATGAGRFVGTGRVDILNAVTGDVLEVGNFCGARSAVGAKKCRPMAVPASAARIRIGVWNRANAIMLGAAAMASLATRFRFIQGMGRGKIIRKYRGFCYGVNRG